MEKLLQHIKSLCSPIGYYDGNYAENQEYIENFVQNLEKWIVNEMDCGRINEILKKAWESPKGHDGNIYAKDDTYDLVLIGEAFFDISDIIPFSNIQKSVISIINRYFPWLLDRTFIRIPFFISQTNGDNVLIYCERDSEEKCFDAQVGIALRCRLATDSLVNNYYIVGAKSFYGKQMFMDAEPLLQNEMNRNGFKRIKFAKTLLRSNILLVAPYKELAYEEENFILEYTNAGQILICGRTDKSAFENEYDIILSCCKGDKGYKLLWIAENIHLEWKVRLYRTPDYNKIYNVKFTMKQNLPGSKKAQTTPIKLKKVDFKLN